jgi:hypothetical protein
VVVDLVRPAKAVHQHDPCRAARAAEVPDAPQLVGARNSAVGAELQVRQTSCQAAMIGA